MTKKKTRIKSAATLRTLQTREQVISVGDTHRKITRLETQINDELARLTHKHAADIEDKKAHITLLQKCIQNWCESNREELTENGKTKIANLITSEVS